MKHRLVVALVLVSAGCSRDARTEPPAAVPAGGTLAASPAGAIPAELSFVPADVDALVRVDLGAVAERSPDAARTLDFVLRAQHPRVHSFLTAAGLAVGRDIPVLVLVAGPGAAYAVAGLGDVDDARLSAPLKRTGAAVEPSGKGVVYTWKKVAPGSTESPALDEDVAVGLDRGILLAGTPDLVRRALLARAGRIPGLMQSRLLDEIAAADTKATVWGVAVPGPGAALAESLPGLRRARFASIIVAPGPAVDGLFDLRAEFGAPAQAEAFRARLDGYLSMFAALGGKGSLGATLARLRQAAKLRVEGSTVIAQTAL